MEKWKEAIDSNTGRTYYFNEDTLEVSWQKPGASSNEEDDPWLEVTDPKSGRTYFYNTKTKETSWTKPSSVLNERDEKPNSVKREESTKAMTTELHALDDRLEDEKTKASHLTETLVEDSIHIMSDKAKMKISVNDSEMSNLEKKLQKDEKKVEEDKKELETLAKEIRLDEHLVEDRAKEIVLKDRFEEDASREVVDVLKLAASHSEEERSRAREKLEKDKERVQDDKETAERLSREIEDTKRERLEISKGEITQHKQQKKSYSSSSAIEIMSDMKSAQGDNDDKKKNNNIFGGTSSKTSTGMKSISFRGKSSYGSSNTIQEDLPPHHYPIASSTSSSVTTTNVFVYESVIEFKFLALASAFALLFLLILYRRVIRRRGGPRNNAVDKKRSSARKNTSVQMSLMGGEDEYSYNNTTSKMRHRHAGKIKNDVAVEFIPQRKGMKKLKNSLLSVEHIRAIVNAMPSRLQATDWKLMYSSELHGYSLQTLYTRARKLKGPSVLVVKDTDGHIFGGFASHTWRKNVSFFGTGECFLFSLSPKIKMYSWTGANSQFLLAREECIGFGGGGSFGLWLDADFETGNSNPSTTFSNPALSSKTDFSVTCVEVWGMDNCL